MEVMIDRLNRAKVKIQAKNPFFAYLSLWVRFKEASNLGVNLAGVDIDGNFYYNESEMQKLNDNEIVGVLAHEILHLALLHLDRVGTRNPLIFNYATDLVINTMLVRNNFNLPNGCIVAGYDNTFKMGSVNIIDCDKKMAEAVYDEMIQQLPEEVKKSMSNGKSRCGGAGNDSFDRFKPIDEHIYSKLSDKEKKALMDEWKDRAMEGYSIAKMKGNIPLGIERIIENLHAEKINWRAILSRFITQSIPCDYSYRTPHKKSISVGEYLPNVVKEKIEVVLAIDLSGSIEDKEFKDFFSEVVGIARAYQNRIDIKVYTHDSECYFAGLVRNGNIEKLKQLKFKGGGGTTFNSVIDKLKKDKVNPKCLLWFTDGYGEKIPKQNYPVLWVLTENGSDNEIKDCGRVVWLK